MLSAPAGVKREQTHKSSPLPSFYFHLLSFIFITKQFWSIPLSQALSVLISLHIILALMIRSNRAE